VAYYCNGSKRPPEAVCHDNNSGIVIPCGYNVPPGTNETNVPNPVFNLTASATVDEGNNWVSISWGPLALSAPWKASGGTAPLADFTPAAGSLAINYINAANSPVSYALAPANDFFGNARKTNGAVDAGAIESPFTPPPPTLTSIAPNSGVRGGAPVNVTLTGTNLTNASAITVSGLGVTCSNPTVVNATTATSTCTIAGNATLSARNVSITTPGGISNTVTFTVLSPTLTSVAPNTGVQGTVVNVTLTGTGLANATAVNVSGGGVNVSNQVNVNDTTVTATFTITAGATANARNVTITTPGGTTTAVTFTVTAPPAPALTSITPNSGLVGSSVNVTLAGTGFTGATGIGGRGGIILSNFIVVSDTQITATFNLAGVTGPYPANRNITVTKGGGVTSNALPFTVNGPTVTSITPNSAPRPSTGTSAVSVTITGTNFPAGTTLRGLGGNGLTATNVTVVNSTTITATFNITSTATRTTRQIGVTTPASNSSNTVGFTIQ